LIDLSWRRLVVLPDRVVRVASTVPRLRPRLGWDEAAGASEEPAGNSDGGDAQKRDDGNYGEHGLTSWFGQVVGQGPVVVLQHATGPLDGDRFRTR
jgi:hypothetical protein